MSDLNEKLGQFLTESQNWKKKATNIQGVFLLKLPSPPPIARNKSGSAKEKKRNNN